MRASDIRQEVVTRHGAYLCIPELPPDLQELAGAAVSELCEQLGLRNEFGTSDGHPPLAIAFLRRLSATPADIDDDGLLSAVAVVHVAAPTAEPVTTFCDELVRLLGPAGTPHILGGIVRPTRFTSNEMHNYSYAQQIVQQPGGVMPNAFLVPMSKSAAWWEKDWMERHTYFLPRYDDAGRMLNEGHALATQVGIDHLMRRTYKHATEPAPEGAYDFVTYFECTDEGVPVFHEVCAALRDTTRNPEWRFVREGPTWQGRRVATWAELFA